jgi:GntR family transcriptional regulator
MACRVARVEVGGSFPYRRIVAELRSEIVSGERAPGSRMPSENELADRFDTSRPTVRRAIAELKTEGLVVTGQGRATLVRPTPHIRLLLAGTSYRRHRNAGMTGFNAQVIEQGQRPEQRLFEVTTVTAPEEVASRLDLDEAADVVVRRRIFLVDDHAVALVDSYYPASMAAGTAIAELRRVPGGVHAVIEDPEGPIGRHIARSVDELVARMPTPDETERLSLPPGVPIVRVLRTIYDTAGQPVEVQETVAAADRHEFRYEVDMT